MRILGIETSCDETAAAVVEDGQRLLSNVIASSIDLHKIYGGVVPEIAARSHLESILPVINKALAKAKTDWNSIDAIAVSHGPGLIGSLLIGVLTARTLAIAKNKPLIGVNHVAAHPYAAFLTGGISGYQYSTSEPTFLLLALIVSGGHTQLVLYKNHKDYSVLGQTVDDAVGEAFDKVAKMLGLPYPGGPSIAQAAKKGDPGAIRLPTANMSGYNLSFSGLKTAVLRAAQALVGQDYTFPSSKLPEALSPAQKSDLAASFQAKVVETLVNALQKATIEFQPTSVIICGGVAANQHLRTEVEKVLPTAIFPDTKLCTDNAAMIAVLGYYQMDQKHTSDPHSLSVEPTLQM